MQGLTNSRTLHLSGVPEKYGVRVVIREPNGGGSMSVVVSANQLAKEASDLAGGDDSLNTIRRERDTLRVELAAMRDARDTLAELLDRERRESGLHREESLRAEQIVADLEGKINGLVNALAALGGRL